MPRYFFDLYNDEVSLDDEGAVLPGPEEAYGRAMREAREMITASVEEHGKIDLSHRIEVRGESGLVLDRVPFEQAVNFLRTASQCSAKWRWLTQPSSPI
jgi:hypothetical protein